MLAFPRSGWKRPRGSPDGEEGVLDGVLGERRVAQDAAREPVGDAAEAVVELRERGLVGAGSERDERLVGQVREVNGHCGQPLPPAVGRR